MGTCLVLGGAGFIGSHLVDGLLGSGYRVRVFERPHMDRLPALARRERCEIVTGDFLNPEDLARALPGAEIVFHLVATTLPKTSNDNPLYDVETNVLATLRLLALCRRHAVRKLLFASSGGTVYGVPRSLPLAETHPTDPICAYGIHKLAIEKYLGLEHRCHGLDYRVLRLANPYGERQRTDTGQGAVVAFLDRALRGEPIQIWGDGTVVRDYVYVGDVVDAFLRAMQFDGAERIFNIGSGAGTSLNELLREIERLLGRPIAVQYAPSRGFDVPANVLDCSLARARLGWAARTPLAEGLRRTHDRLRAAR